MIFRKKRILWAALVVGGVCTASAIIDRDFDGMSDIWEAHFGLPTNDDGVSSPEQGPAGDLDGDGWTNLQESIAGTNPNLAQPPEGMLQTQITQNPAVPGVFVVSWPTMIGKKYTLMVSPDMSSESWTQVGDPAIGDGSPTPMAIDLTENTPIPERLFWRVSVSDVDSDEDGLSDYEEGLIGTNPAIADTDGDGDLDGEEVNYDTDPLDASSYTVKVVGSFPDFHGDTFYAGYSCNQPVILYFNHVLPTSVTAISSSWMIDLNGESPDTADGVTVILPGRKGVAFIPTGNGFPAWSEDETDLTPPTYQIGFSETSTGIPHLQEFVKSFSITTASGSAGSPWVDIHSPGSGYIDVDCNASIAVKWSEPLAPSTVVPANVSLVPDGGSPVTCTVSFDYTKDVDQMTIVPSAALAPNTLYTVTIGTGFTNLTSKAHTQAVSWSFTTRPVRPTPAGSGPNVVSVTPADFAFGIAPPTSVSLTFSEAMDASTLTPDNVHLVAGYGPDLQGTFTYTSATKTLEFVPTAALPEGQYFTLTLDLGAIMSAPTTGSPLPMQGNGTFVFATAPAAGSGGSGGPGGGGGGGGAGGGGAGGAGGGAPPPGTIAPLTVHYAWGEVFEPDGDAGCTVEVKLINKIGLETIKTLSANTEVIQVQESGPIDPATTVIITPTLVLGTDKDKEEEAEESGVFIRPSDGYVAPGMTYLVFRKTPASSTTSDPASVEYLGVFGGSDSFAVNCGNGTDIGPQSLYLVPVPIERKLPGSGLGWNLIENQHAKALPGQKIYLRLEDDYLIKYGPGGVVIDGYDWTQMANTFKDYTVIYTTVGGATSGKVKPFVAADFSGQEVDYYWADSGFKLPDLSFFVSIDDLPVDMVTATANINVEKPISVLTTTAHSVRIGMGPAGVNAFGFLGNTTPFAGIVFSGSVTTPPGWPVGRWNWVQTIVSSRKFIDATTGNHSHLGNGIAKKLDSFYPYHPLPTSGNPLLAGSNPADGTTKADASDTPSEPTAGYSRIEISESFETYIMFRALEAESRYVPLRKVDWTWGGIASSADSFTNVTLPVVPTNPTGAEYSIHPEWTENSKAEAEVADP